MQNDFRNSIRAKRTLSYVVRLSFPFPPLVHSTQSLAWIGPPGLGALDALAVDDRGRGAGIAPDPFAICHHERVVYHADDPLPDNNERIVEVDVT